MGNREMKLSPVLLSLTVFLILAVTVSAAEFNASYGTNMASNGHAQAALDRAISGWSKYLNDPIAVNLDFDFQALGQDSAGEVSPTVIYGDYDMIRNMLVSNDARSYNSREALLLPNLPTASQFSANIPTGFNLQKNLSITQANYHALGGSNFTGSDGSIVFSSDYAWDFDRSDGIGSGMYDFEGAAMHQIGHVLGFTTELDYIDWVMSDGGSNDTVWPTVMDLFRFDPATISDPIFDFATAQRNLTPGGKHAFYFGDGFVELSAGEHFGDGSGGANWNQLMSQGVMDASMAEGQMLNIAGSDLVAMDLMGWDIDYSVVPEPATIVLLGIGAVSLGRTRLRKKQARK